MKFGLSKRSWEKLNGVHPDLIKVVVRALELSQVDFAVTEGLRTDKRQKELFAAKATKTLNSRHIPGPDGYGKAVDLAPIIAGKICWDWPPFHQIAEAMKAAAAELGVAITWGGDWKTFKDGPHFELTWKEYP